MSTPAKKPAARRSAATQGAWDKFRATNSKRRWLLALKWATAVGLSFVLFIVAAGFVLYETTKIPDPNAAYQSQATLVYYSDGQAVVGEFATQYRIPLTYNQMPATIKNAVVAAEDRTFWTNNGIDLRGIIRALVHNASGNSLQGASTITQQYVKLMYLTDERSYTRKIKEAILAVKLEQSVPKQEILTRYLNAVYFGRGAYGIEAAAESYFGKHAAKLNTREAAMLASIINNPNNLDPHGGADEKAALTGRYDYVLQGMVSTGNLPSNLALHYITLGLPDSKPAAVNRNSLGGQKGHALKLVEGELTNLKAADGQPLFTSQQIESGGLRITTTLQQKAMNAAEQGVLSQRPKNCANGAGDACTSDKNLHIGVAMVQPGTGDLVGFYGGQDYVESQYNWAVVGGMAGSSIKPITLATALDSGYSLKSTWFGNSPYYYPGAPQNPSVSCPSACVVNEGEQAGEANGHAYGDHISTITALEQSVNTAFIDITQSIPNGPQQIYNTALAMGLTPYKADSQHPGIPSTTRDLSPVDNRITLGKAIVSPINMANAYATIANGGMRADVHVVDKVTDSSGRVLYQFKAPTSRAIPQDVADDVSYAMQQVIQHGTGANAADLGCPATCRPAAGKTGTATNGAGHVSSAWFTGFTPQISVSVMYVRGNGIEGIDGWMPSYFGANYPTYTWKAIVNQYLGSDPVEQFPPAANVAGKAPQSGHSYTPPPPAAPAPPAAPVTKPKPTKTPKPTPTPDPSTTPDPKPSPSPIVTISP